MCPCVQTPGVLREMSESPFCPRLSKREMAAISDALPQAKMTLPLLDGCNRNLAPVRRIRALEIGLTNRLEHLIAGLAQAPEAPP